MALKKIVYSVFSKHTLPKAKIWLVYLNFHKFFSNECQIHSKKHVKSCLCIEFEVNC